MKKLLSSPLLAPNLAVLLHLIAQVDRATPVLFLETGKHFPATLRYRDELVGELGMTDVHDIHPLQQTLKDEDPYGAMSMTNKDRCCYIRKVEPMARAVAPYRAWMTGRKQFQASTRNALPVFESVGERIRINPLAQWTSADLQNYMVAQSLACRIRWWQKAIVRSAACPARSR